MNQCNDCFLMNKKANEEKEQKKLEEKQKLEQRARDKRSAADAAAVPPKRRKLAPKEKAKPKDRPPVPRWSQKDFPEGPYDETAKKKPFEGDGDQCLTVKKWGRIKKDLLKSQGNMLLLN